MKKEEFLEKYPNHCKNCNGYGGCEVKAPAFRRNGCPECFEKKLCPRCKFNLNDMYECDKCGWKIGIDGMPK